jgi:uncharacterized protein
MQINVAQLLKEPQGSSRVYELDDVVNDDTGEIHVCGKVTLTHTNQRILVQGKLKTDVELMCSRCLKSYTCIIPIKIEDEFYPTIDVTTGVKLPPPDEAGAFTIDEHHILDLTDAIRQYKMMALPMKPLCCEDCAGLCTICGQDLNQGKCECTAEPIDPRWAELLKISGKNTVKVSAERKSRKGRK